MKKPGAHIPQRLFQPYDWAHTGPVRGLRSDIQQTLLFPLVRWFARLDVRGKRNLNQVEGPVVLVSNHTSHLDCPVILAALPFRLRQKTMVAAAADYFYKVAAVGALTSLALGTIPFERHEGSRESLERCKEGLRRGWSVLLFPEGSRSKTGELGDFKLGASYMCVDVRCAAVPIFLQGAYDIFPKGATFPRHGDVTVRFGKPVGPTPADDYVSFNQRLHDAIVELGARPAGEV
ncbi:MAG: lysophospholipid acyltransferase family protein [Actinomycetota bacterium]|nr:1-acyl-sn-glycerol-3-phosphate acyltransferase [Actinomycetota bacterium]